MGWEEKVEEGKGVPRRSSEKANTRQNKIMDKIVNLLLKSVNSKNQIDDRKN